MTLIAKTGVFHRTIHPTHGMLAALSEGFCPFHHKKLTPNEMDAGECPHGDEWVLLAQPQSIYRLNGEAEWQMRVDEPPIAFMAHPAEWPCHPRGDGTTLDWPFNE